MTAARLKIIGSFVATFVLGALAGGGADHALVARQVTDMFDASSHGSRHGVFLWSLERKLDLSAAQRAKIEAILQRYDGEMRAASAPVEARTGQVRGRIRGEIRAELTSEQRAAFDRLMASRDANLGRTTAAPSAAAPSAATPSAATPSAATPSVATPPMDAP